MPLQATSGAASYDAFGGGAAAVPQYIEDLFQTWLYTGTGASQTITNGIDLTGKGGLVWLKRRSTSQNHLLFDTTRGATQRLFSNLNNAQDPDAQSLTAFTASGFSLGTDSGANGLNETFASWTFREQPKFFDVVTWTGNSTAGRTIAHNLDSVPGCIIVKCTSDITDWAVYHRSLSSAANALQLNTTGAQFTATTYWNSTAPTSSVFTVGADNDVNASGRTYVAYVFAHNAGGFGLSGTDNAISCGSFTTDGSGNASVNLGYEAQWVLLKRSSGVEGWMLFDNMRGLVATPAVGNYSKKLTPNSTAAEADGDECRSSSTGFNVGGVLSGATYIYVAVRRGPMRTPTTGTSVFTPVARSGTGSTSTVSNGITTDLIISMTRNTGQASGVWDRLRGFPAYLETNGTATESTSSDSVTAMNNTAYVLGADGGTDRINRSGYTYANWTFSRAPGFFDEVCYTGGTGTPRVLNHNLIVSPELIITKVRNFTGEDWVVNYSNGSTIIGGYLNSTAAFSNSSTAPSTDITSLTSTTYTLNTSNRRVNGAYNYVAYLFASVPGVSKVGSYTGTGTTQTINCGFTAGSRFVLIKRTDSTGDWYVWDSARGIVAGNDPYLLLNSTAAEVTSTDWVDTAATGFELSSTAPAAINASGGTFIFLAIA